MKCQQSTIPKQSWKSRTGLAVQLLGLCAFTAEGAGLVPGQGTKIPQAERLLLPNIKTAYETTVMKIVFSWF